MATALQVGATYTWSRLTGNDESEGAATATSPNQALATWYPEYLNYEQRRPIGYLGQDVRHRARLWVGYELPTRIGTFDGTVLQAFDSGYPYSAFQNIDASGRNTPFPGSLTNPGYTSQLGRLIPITSASAGSSAPTTSTRRTSRSATRSVS